MRSYIFTNDICVDITIFANVVGVIFFPMYNKYSLTPNGHTYSFSPLFNFRKATPRCIFGLILLKFGVNM
jgi:hypothetical protein